MGVFLYWFRAGSARSMLAFRRRGLLSIVLPLGVAVAAMCAVPGTSLAAMPTPEWAAQTTAESPSASEGASMAYDPATGKMVLFGGGDSSGLSDETWTYDGTSWTKQTTAESPSARFSSAMAYDPATGKMVLFGGTGDTGEDSETWTYDGSTWTEQTIAGGPSIRYGSAMAYDPATGKMVLFGGESEGADSDETWIYNGSTWTKQTTIGSPSASAYASMAYDPATGKMVLFGGRTSTGHSNETWTYNGSEWTKQTTTVGPSARYAAMMAYDSATGELVLFGGGYTNETWAYDGSTWTEQTTTQSPLINEAAPSMAYDPATGGLVLFGVLASGGEDNATWTYGFPAGTVNNWIEQVPAESPPASRGASMTYDPATGKMVLFGGYDQSEARWSGETWTYDGSTWTEQTIAGGPPARFESSMAYDPATGKIVLFGGSDESGWSDETWTYDGSDWTKQSPGQSPPALAEASMAYDPATGELVLFGGQSGLQPRGETWTYDGSTWTEQTIAGGPSAREGASMAYDPATGKMVLFGGLGESDWSGETWTYDGSTWTEQTIAGGPSARSESSMTYDPATGKMVLFGGRGASGWSGETWTYDGSTWEQESPAQSPSARSQASMAFDPATGKMVLFGGFPVASSSEPTWIYQPFVKASPSLSTTASAGVAVGGKVYDEATLSGGESPSGSIVFKLYGPEDETCSSTPVYQSTETVSGNGSYKSEEFTTTEPGTYRWIAAYEGDLNNEAEAGTCGEADETVAVSPGNSTWTGGAANGASSWSDGSNWSSGVAPTPSWDGTLTFPALASCDSSTNTCYTSENDLTGVVAKEISIDDGSGYDVTGNPITLGEGGINAATTGFTSTSWAPAITLSADQTWSLNGGTLDLQSDVTGPTDTLGIDLTNSAILGMSEDNELGAVTITGGSAIGDRVIFYTAGGSLNGTDGNAVSLTDVDLGTIFNLSVGPLTLTGADLSLGGTSGGTPETPVVSVDGAASLGSNSELALSIAPNGSAPSAGSNYSQLSASGNVTVGGDLVLDQLASTCTALTPGAVYTLAQSTGGTLSGTFANAPQDGTATVDCGVATEGTVRLNYTSTELTATVIATPSLSASGPGGGTVGSAISASSIAADLSSGSSPTGTVTFKVFGPQATAPTECGTGGTTVGTASVSGEGTYNPSAGFTPSAPGDYWWYASYGGDSNNNEVNSGCGASMAKTVVGKASQSISFGSLSGRVVGESDFSVSATASSGLAVVFSSSTPGVCTVSGSTVHSVAAGTCTIVASQAGDAVYEAASSVSRSFGVSSPAAVVVVSKPTPAGCPSVNVHSSNYKPRPPKSLAGRIDLPGLRARLSVVSPVLLKVRLTLTYRHAGKSRKVGLGERTLSDSHTADLHLVLPADLRGDLPKGSDVTLSMQIGATAKGVSGCKTAYTESLALHTHIVILYLPPH